MKNIWKSPEDIDFEIVEWVDGERLALREYELRLSQQISTVAGQYLIKMNDDLNWIFGLSN